MASVLLLTMCSVRGWGEELNASRANRAIRADARAAEQLHIRADKSIRPRGYAGINHNCVRKLNARAGIHQLVRRASPECTVNFRKFCTRVAA